MGSTKLKRAISVVAVLFGLLWAQPVWAAITHVQAATKTWDSDTVTGVSTPNFGSSVTSGNWIIVGIRGATAGGSTISSVTDTLGTSYNLAVSKYDGTDLSQWIYFGKLTSSGTNAVSVAFSASPGLAYGWIDAVEVSGLAASSPLDITDSKSGNPGGTDLQTNAITTTVANEYIFVNSSICCSYDAGSAGAGYTLISNNSGDGTGGGKGVSQYKITSGTISSTVQHVTAASSQARYAIVLAAFSDGGGGGGATSHPCGNLLLLGVGCEAPF